VSIKIILGNGKLHELRSDQWIDSQSIAELSPKILAVVTVHAVKRRSLMKWSWVCDITTTLNALGIIEYVHLNVLIRHSNVCLEKDVQIMWP
jgi:hypothetical protein